MKKIVLYLLAGLFLTTLTLSPGAKAADTTSQNPRALRNSTRPTAIPAKTIIFFMNPNGAPCQMQDRILRSLADQFKGKAQVKYYKTTEPADLDQFAAQGVRGLPMLIVTDKNQRVVRRFSPGIQSKEAILAAVNAD